MHPPNSDRVLLRALGEICTERNIEMTTFSQDWVIRLGKGDRTRFVFGYNFDLNSATAHLLANDKAAASSLMQAEGIPNVEHKFFLHPDRAEYVSGNGNWTDILAFAQKHDFDLVCKPNDGTCGFDCLRVRSPRELEEAVHNLLRPRQSLCLSPYHDIENEYRLILIDGERVLAYAKTRPSVIGDGRSTVLQLWADGVGRGELSPMVAADLFADDPDRIRYVPAEKEVCALNWRHNLNRGARVQEIENPDTLRRLATLAVAGVKALNLRFASVDLIETQEQLLVLEINSGIMMESYARTAPDGYRKAKTIYARAVDLMFDG